MRFVGKYCKSPVDIDSNETFNNKNESQYTRFFRNAATKSKRDRNISWWLQKICCTQCIVIFGILHYFLNFYYIPAAVTNDASASLKLIQDLKSELQDSYVKKKKKKTINRKLKAIYITANIKVSLKLKKFHRQRQKNIVDIIWWTFNSRLTDLCLHSTY